MVRHLFVQWKWTAINQVASYCFRHCYKWIYLIYLSLLLEEAPVVAVNLCRSIEQVSTWFQSLDDTCKILSTKKTSHSNEHVYEPQERSAIYSNGNRVNQFTLAVCFSPQLERTKLITLSMSPITIYALIQSLCNETNNMYSHRYRNNNACGWLNNWMRK